MPAKESETPISNTDDSNDVTDDDTTGDDTTGDDIAGNVLPGIVLTDTELAEILCLTYEQARDELISIVAQLEGGQIGLDESMALWQRGEALAGHCNTWLDGAEAKLTTITEAKHTNRD